MSPMPSRRSLLKLSAGVLAAQTLPWRAAMAATPPRDIAFVEDFDELWRTMGERYCYFQEKATDWNAVRALYRPLAQAAPTTDAFAEIVIRTVNELYDAHTHLNDAPENSVRLPYLDLWIDPDRGGRARITSVREGSAAAGAGIVAGDIILRVDGTAVAEAANAVAPRCLARPDPAAVAYAFNLAVAGRRGQPRRFAVRSAGGRERELLVPLETAAQLPDVDSRLLPGGYGLIAIRSFAGDAVLAAFDAALLRLRDTPGIIVDLRRNGGGDTAIARPMMGRFVAEARPYAYMRRREGASLSDRWVETVEPRGPFTYRGPVVVLTSRWSASMAEGFPMGMKDIGRATIVGTPMMGLGAGVFPLRLDRTGLQLQYSAEPVYDTNDRPRSFFRPDVEVSGGADILAAGLSVLERQGHSAHQAAVDLTRDGVPPSGGRRGRDRR